MIALGFEYRSGCPQTQSLNRNECEMSWYYINRRKARQRDFCNTARIKPQGPKFKWWPWKRKRKEAIWEAWRRKHRTRRLLKWAGRVGREREGSEPSPGVKPEWLESWWYNRQKEESQETREFWRGGVILSFRHRGRGIRCQGRPEA